VHAVRANRDAVEVVRRLSTQRTSALATSDRVAPPGEVG
jgi:hypothetical protein